MRISKTFLKTISYAFMHMSIAVTIAYALSGSWKVALAIGLIEPLVQTVAFFFHEKAWHKHEHKNNNHDHHDSVIDSVSPVTEIVEKILNNKHKN